MTGEAATLAVLNEFATRLATIRSSRSPDWFTDVKTCAVGRHMPDDQRPLPGVFVYAEEWEVSKPSIGQVPVYQIDMSVAVECYTADVAEPDAAAHRIAEDVMRLISRERANRPINGLVMDLWPVSCAVGVEYFEKSGRGTATVRARLIFRCTFD